MRDLIDVIEQILEVVPEFESEFTSLKQSVLFSSPEMLPMWWRQGADILEGVATGHPKEAEIAAIWMDPE